jgi:hypothetical protein
MLLTKIARFVSPAVGFSGLGWIPISRSAEDGWALTETVINHQSASKTRYFR